MPSNKLTLRLMLAAVVLCAQAQTPNVTGIVRGRISDETGGAMYHGYVLFHSDQAGKDKQVVLPDVTRDTDRNGRFEVQLETGFYDVCAMGWGFTAQCKKILVTQGKTIQHDVKLKLDPLVSKYLGEVIKR